MTDTSSSKSKWPVWRVFSGALAFVGWGCGLYASVLFSDAIGLRDYVRGSEAAGLFGGVPMGFLGLLLMIGTKPRDRQQLGLLLALGVPLTFWFGLAGDAARAAQHAIARDGSVLILMSAFVTLAVPVFAPVWRIIERSGMAEPDEGERGRPGGVVAAVAISLPGMMAGTLEVDLLRATAWVQMDSEQAAGWVMAPMLFAVIALLPSAQPDGERDWVMLGGVLMAAIIASVLAGAGLLSLAQPLDQPTGGTFFLGLAAFAAGPLIGWAARRIAHRLARGDSPWRKHMARRWLL